MPTGSRTKASGGRASVSFLLDLVVLRTQGDGRIWYGIRSSLERLEMRDGLMRSDYRMDIALYFWEKRWFYGCGLGFVGSQLAKKVMCCDGEDDALG